MLQKQIVDAYCDTEFQASEFFVDTLSYLASVVPFFFRTHRFPYLQNKAVYHYSFFFVRFKFVGGRAGLQIVIYTWDIACLHIYKKELTGEDS